MVPTGRNNQISEDWINRTYQDGSPTDRNNQISEDWINKTYQDGSHRQKQPD